jgi:MoxR-like ATPase
VTVQTDDGGTAAIVGGRVRCRAFPFVVLTSNNEREFPPAFLRRCLRLEIPPPDEAKLREIVALQLPEPMRASTDALIAIFLKRRAAGDLATDQLLNAIFLTSQGIDSVEQDKERFVETVMGYLNSADAP